MIFKVILQVPCWWKGEQISKDIKYWVSTRVPPNILKSYFKGPWKLSKEEYTTLKNRHNVTHKHPDKNVSKKLFTQSNLWRFDVQTHTHAAKFAYLIWNPNTHHCFLSNSKTIDWNSTLINSQTTQQVTLTPHMS